MGISQFIQKYIQRKKYKLPERTLEDLKQISRIVFVDNQNFEVVKILKNAGWINTKLIRDVDSLDSLDIAEAHIIFVDIHDVGQKLKFKDEGLGLITAIRKKYPHKKLIVYSAQQTGDRFHEGFSSADARLAKNADPFQFQTLVEEFSRDAFSLTECVIQLQKVLRRDFGIEMTRKEIIDNITSIARKGDYSDAVVSRFFSLSNAGSVASIISIFLTGR